MFGNKAESGGMKALFGSLMSLLQRADSAYFEQWASDTPGILCFQEAWSPPNDIG
jgi:hypothetical protein